VVELPGCAPFAEIGIDPEAGAWDMAWVGTPPRLVVLSRYAAHTRVHLVDPYGPRTIAEIRLESPMTLFGTVGSHALAVGAVGAAVLTASETQLTPYQFPARSVPLAAGAAGTQFMVALPNALEEWDPHSRMPKRRLKLPRPSVIGALGGSDRNVWVTTQGDPTRIDVIPLVSHGQPRAHRFPEPIAHVAAHPRTDLIACVGADSGRLFVVDLDGRTGLRIVGPEGIDRVEAAALVVGRMVGVLAAQAGHPVTLVPLDGREPKAVPVAPAASVLKSGEPEPAPKKSSLVDDSGDRGPTWRDDAVRWYRAVAAGTVDREAPISIAIDQLLLRLELPADLQPALALLYGAHLAGEGAAPIDVSRVLGRDWDEALGNGELARRGVATYEGSRVRMTRAILRALDERPPETGTLVGEPGTVALLGPCAVVVADPLADLAEHAGRFLGPVGSAILAAHTHADPRGVLVEARAHGAVPMVRVGGPLETIPDQPVILVAFSEHVAAQLGVPRID
jgi:hypothetical protein